MKKLNPLSDFFHYHILFFTGKIEFPREKINQDIKMENRSEFKIFLHIVNKEKLRNSQRKVKLIVSFRVKKMSLFQRKLLPVLSTPFFAGCPGFISKMFLMNEQERTFRGIYEWASEEAVRSYISSYPNWFMTKNAVSGSLSYMMIDEFQHELPL
ncbi:MAG: YdhR family protein [Clostridia bacterium]|nr:YdhR family protein [Clostridia bacterium]